MTMRKSTAPRPCFAALRAESLAPAFTQITKTTTIKG
jgi:hypothetical protein